jgi:hypothetical protein
MANYVGGCQCGAVRYELSEPPIRSFQCQCRDCQKDTGGGHSSVMVFASRAFHLKGEARETLRTADSGARKRKGFCPACGSPLYNKPEAQPDYIGIYVGSPSTTPRPSSRTSSCSPRAAMPGIIWMRPSPNGLNGTARRERHHAPAGWRGMVRGPA